MSNMLASASTLLGKVMQSHMAVDVVYSRGVDSVAVKATRGQSTFDQVDREGVSHQIESLDYLIPPASLILDSITVLPIAGDRLVETVDGKIRTYAVMDQTGRQPFSVESNGAWLRIHTRLVDVADV